MGHLEFSLEHYIYDSNVLLLNLLRGPKIYANIDEFIENYTKYFDFDFYYFYSVFKSLFLIEISLFFANFLSFLITIYDFLDKAINMKNKFGKKINLIISNRCQLDQISVQDFVTFDTSN